MKITLHEIQVRTVNPELFKKHNTFSMKGLQELANYFVRKGYNPYSEYNDSIFKHYIEIHESDLLDDYKMTFEELCEETEIIYIPHTDRIIFRKF